MGIGKKPIIVESQEKERCEVCGAKEIVNIIGFVHSETSHGTVYTGAKYKFCDDCIKSFAKTIVEEFSLFEGGDISGICS